MGNYVSTTSLSLLLPQFLDTNTTTGDAEGVLIWQRHVARAEGVVNGAIVIRYDISGFTTTPPLLITLTEDIAVYFTMRASYSQDGKEKNQYLADFETAKDMLKEIQKGDLLLSYTNGSVVSPLTASRFQINTAQYTPIFDLDNPKVWDVDSDRKDDMADAR